MIEREERGGVVTLRLAHGKASALDVELTEGIRRELGAAVDASAVVLTGTGSIFSAGVDLFRVLDGGAEYVRRFLPSLVDTIRELFVFPKPVVVAANGHAIAGGGILTAAGDYRLMARGGGRIGVPELVVGVPFPAIALEVVRYALAPNQLHEAVYLGRTYTPEEALACGFVDELADPDALAGRAHEVALHLASVPHAAFRIAKRQLRAPALERAEAFAAFTDAEAAAAWAAPETHEHIRAYLERTIGKRR
jgi:enoyl-CoA hydratase